LAKIRRILADLFAAKALFDEGAQYDLVGSADTSGKLPPRRRQDPWNEKKQTDAHERRRQWRKMAFSTVSQKADNAGLVTLIGPAPDLSASCYSRPYAH